MGALEALLLDDSSANIEDSQENADLAARAQGALEALLIVEDGDEGDESQEQADLAAKAQDTLEAVLLDEDEVANQAEEAVLQVLHARPILLDLAGGERLNAIDGGGYELRAHDEEEGLRAQ